MRFRSCAIFAERLLVMKAALRWGVAASSKVETMTKRPAFERPFLRIREKSAACVILRERGNFMEGGQRLAHF